ncbi:ABC transporter permease [Actinotalea sp. M2MS4P-6]|uniref:ABC transporter permease n=1 Tax=Actinotalea sp. M2MS4P-6 TaxID=2983762 RepID=UPI0021E4E587|nr:ABC transporter permease [Actinotalea sp. M2MS4P-6]MCV2395031.1 ABC transporter permease [Actinotalea sp. M2MS4P-6]
MSTTTNAPAEAPSSTAARFNLGAFAKKYLIVLILIGLVILLTILTDGAFIKTQNLINVIRQVSAIGIIAAGMVFVIITLGIDLSVGSIVAMSAVVGASLAQTADAAVIKFPGLDVPVIVAVLAGLAVGAGAGFVNGFLITKFKIAPFIATLGMMTAGRGAAYIFSNGRPISTLKDGYNWIGQGSLLGVPVPILLFAIVVLIASVMLNRTRFGRYTYAIGGNEQAARVSGINIDRVKLGIYVFIGTLAGLAGLVLSARIGSGNPTLGTGLELDVIAATVIGGTSFAGGIGTIWGSVVGALIIGSINNGLDLLNVSPFWQQVVKGLIIVVAIIIDERKNR